MAYKFVVGAGGVLGEFDRAQGSSTNRRDENIVVQHRPLFLAHGDLTRNFFCSNFGRIIVFKWRWAGWRSRSGGGEVLQRRRRGARHCNWRFFGGRGRPYALFRRGTRLFSTTATYFIIYLSETT